jgi:hypothetical protein
VGAVSNQDREDEMTKPFDLEAAKAGAKVKTRNGDRVELFVFDLSGTQPIGGVLTAADGTKSLETWDSSGIYNRNFQSFGVLDLVMVDGDEE